MEKYLDEMFDALYGTMFDEYNQKYSNVYSDECGGICDDVKKNFEILIEHRTIESYDIGNLIIIAEQLNIGNKLLSIDYDKLEKLSEKVLFELS